MRRWPHVATNRVGITTDGSTGLDGEHVRLHRWDGYRARPRPSDSQTVRCNFAPFERDAVRREQVQQSCRLKLHLALAASSALGAGIWRVLGQLRAAGALRVATQEPRDKSSAGLRHRALSRRSSVLLRGPARRSCPSTPSSGARQQDQRLRCRLVHRRPTSRCACRARARRARFIFQRMARRETPAPNGPRPRRPPC